jgi:tetratricopeptide (TPR) repeat protein
MLFEELVAADPNDAQSERMLADCYLEASTYASLEHDDETRERYLALAMQHARKLAAADSTSPHLQHLLATVLLTEADFRTRLKQYVPASEALDEAIATYERLVGANANDSRAVSMLSVCYGQRGAQLQDQDKHDEAIAMFTKAADTARGQLKTQTNTKRIHAGLAYYAGLIGTSQIKAGRVDEAIATFRAALAAIEPVVAAAPDDGVHVDNEILLRRRLAGALVTKSELPQIEPGQRELLRAEALTLLTGARDDYEKFFSSKKRTKANEEALEEMNSQISGLRGATTQPGGR